MQNYKYLNFFNKKGVYCNFEYDETLDKWTGRLDLNIISEGLIEDYQIYILEEVFNKDSKQYEYVKPIVYTEFLPPNGIYSELNYTTDLATKIVCGFQTESPIPELFLYSFDITKSNNILEKTYTMNHVFDIVNYSTGTKGVKSGMKEIPEAALNSQAMQINIGFAPESEDMFGNMLTLTDCLGHVFAEIFIYGESEEEDERLTNLLQSMGYDLLPNDFMIFDESDVNEIKPDWTIVNRKRKELLMEHDNIFPYIGSYKALINIIKFFGYQNLRMKEYWNNVDIKSPLYGKYKQMDIEDIFNEDSNFNTSGMVPNKIYRKTNKFGLFYDITVESGRYDDDGLPIAEETFTYSPQEVLIKIFALKKKLQNYFLGLNSKIVDIIGESVFFAKYEINVWNDQQRIDSISLGIKPTFEVLPSRLGFVEDLRPLNYYGVPIGSDLTIGGVTKNNSWRVGIGNTIDTRGPLNSEQTFELNIQIPIGATIYNVATKLETDVDTGKYIYERHEIADKIITNLKSVNYISTNFNVYQEGGTSGVIRFVQKNQGGTGTIFSKWYSNTSPTGPGTNNYSIPGTTGGTSTYINVSPGETFGATGSPISYYGDSFIGYFDKFNTEVTNLNDDENIPIGYPAVLNNTSFDITWDDSDITFNQIDKNNPSTNKFLFSKYGNSQRVTGWTAGSTPIYTPVSGFPTALYPASGTFTWNNLGYYGYYEMQWIVSKNINGVDVIIANSGRDSIEKLDKYPIVLPYVGVYKVELHLWDGYNYKSSSINTDYIEVEAYDIDFIGWYKKLDKQYLIDTKRLPVQSDIARKHAPSSFSLVPEAPKSEYLTWNEYITSWDMPMHPNEEMDLANIQFNSLDSGEFYKTIKNPTSNPLVDRFAYKFNLLGKEVTLDDLYHLWWDSSGTKVTQFNVTEIAGPTSYMSMTRGNSIYDITKNKLHIVDGPTGYTGPVGVTALLGSTGDIIHSYDNTRSYRYSSGQWKYEGELIDVYRAIGLTGTNKQKFLELNRQLNAVMPNDGKIHPYLTDFIYYFNEEYNSSNQLAPYIRAVSKGTQSNARHKIKYVGMTGDKQSYETVNLGYVGDIPTHFEIYDVNSLSPTGSILISGMTTSYNIGSTNLYNLANELNGPTAQKDPILNKFTFNLVTGYSGSTGPTSLGPTATYTKIQGISKAFKSPDSINVTLTNINGTNYGRSIIRNISWDQLRILKYNQELPLCTTVNFTYDNARMPGKSNPVWILTKEGDPEFDDIYYNNKYFSYMFTEKGSYSLTLQLEDSNGNQKSITKKEIIKII